MAEEHKELAGRIKSDLAETQHRYQLHDPSAETTFRFPTAEAATAKADELGTGRFQHMDANGSAKQVDKVDGQWIQEGGKPLAEVQDRIDLDSLRAIETRAEQRAAVGQGFTADKEMAEADVFAFRRIQNPGWQETAAVEMAHNARQYPDYKEGLDKAIPGYPGTAEKVYAIDAGHSEKLAEKEDRKAQDFGVMIDEVKGMREQAYEIPLVEALQRAQRDADAFDVLHRDEPVMQNSISDGRERAQTQEEATKAIHERREGLGNITSLDDKAAGKLAREDAHDLRLVKDHASAELIAAAMRDNPAYRAEFVKTDTELAQQLAGSEVDRAKNREGDRQQHFTSLASTVDKASAEIEKPKIPQSIEDRYVSVEGRFFERGKTKFFDREDTKLPAFVDKGKALVTSTEDKRVVADMVAMAKSKNWEVLNVKGTEEFRRQVWLEASVQGLEVKGYKPRDADVALLKTLHVERSVNQIQGKEREPATQDKTPVPFETRNAASIDPASRPQGSPTTPTPAKDRPADNLSLLERAKVAAAEKVFLAAVRNIPQEQRQTLLNNLQEKLLDPANVQKLPTPQHYSREQATPQRESNRER